MNNAELIAAVTVGSGLKKKDVELMFKNLKDAFELVLQRGGYIAFSGVGTFSVERRAARRGRNPRTGDPMVIRAKKIVKYKAAPTLSELVGG
jgi:DNA-binding protein HU-beta